MAVTPFSPGNSTGQPGGSTFLDRVLAAVARSFDSLKNAVTNDRLVTATIGTGDTRITHGLGAPVRTWEVVDRDANAVVWRSATVNATDKQTILLVASATVKVTLRFT